jgi:hypothetical protein|tara:strand:+ start:7090 stop:9255 length:2166 start_codon:yes stop_codon:yes gene_type:complete
MFLDVTGGRLDFIGLVRVLPLAVFRFYGFLECTGSSTEFSYVKRLFDDLCKSLDLPLLPLVERSSQDMLDAIRAFQELGLIDERVLFYKGWESSTSDGKTKHWHLQFFHQQYGADHTARLWLSTKQFSLTHKHATLTTYTTGLNAISTDLIALYPTQSELHEAGTYKNINSTVRTIFIRQLIDTKINGSSIKTFYNKTWPKRLTIIEKTLIASGIWSKPPEDLWCPRFKVSSASADTHKIYDKNGNAFTKKLITYIPLSFSDDKTIEVLLQSIEDDLEHVVSACELLVKQSLDGLSLRLELSKKGRVKVYGESNGYNVDHAMFIDMDDEANQCATLMHYGCYGIPSSNPGMFLNINTKYLDFVQKFGLLHPSVLFPFIYLLIQEHPKITPSWFINFELFDKNGRLEGFRQSGGIWVATGKKPRKGSEKSPQTLILNDKSKFLIEGMIAMTAEARKYLKSNGDDSYRFLLLSSVSGFSSPARKKGLPSPRAFCRNSPLTLEILKPTAKIDAEKAGLIVENLSLGTFRASCGVRVYLREKSTQAMSEALGHTSYVPYLLSHYLPEAIQLYFQTRWVLIFQNALVYDAMKESDYLLQTLNFGETELEVFLKNHQLKPIPEHVMTGQIKEFEAFNKVSLADTKSTVSIPVTIDLLRVMLSIVTLVESAKAEQVITLVAAKWYDSARFTIESIKTNCVCPKIKRAFEEAVSTPLCNSKLTGAVYAS